MTTIRVGLLSVALSIGAMLVACGGRTGDGEVNAQASNGSARASNGSAQAWNGSAQGSSGGSANVTYPNVVTTVSDGGGCPSGCSYPCYLAVSATGCSCECRTTPAPGTTSANVITSAVTACASITCAFPSGARCTSTTGTDGCPACPVCTALDGGTLYPPAGPVDCSTINVNSPELTYSLAYCLGQLCGTFTTPASCQSTAQYIRGDGFSVCQWDPIINDDGGSGGGTCVQR